MKNYGLKINFKAAGEKVIVLGQPYEFRKGKPVFALGNSDGSSNLETADSIRTNWNAWAKDYFSKEDQLTIAEAEAKELEIL